MHKCLNCNKEFKISFRSNEKFCSHACAIAYHNNKRKVERFCVVCGKKLTGKQKRFCSDECRHRQHTLNQMEELKGFREVNLPEEKPKPKPKIPAHEVEKIARAEGLTYGQCVAKYGF